MAGHAQEGNGYCPGGNGSVCGAIIPLKYGGKSLQVYKEDVHRCSNNTLVAGLVRASWYSQVSDREGPH